jgi:oligogalacturonide lyase
MPQVFRSIFKEDVHVIGKIRMSEIREFKDEKTGRPIKQLTTTSNNVHLCFAVHAFVEDKDEIVFRSDRDAGDDRAPHAGPFCSLFRMNLDTGEMVQLTDEAATTTGDETGSIHSVTKMPDGEIIAYRSGNKIRKLDTLTGVSRTLHEETGNFSMGSPSLAPIRRYIAFARVETQVRLCRRYSKPLFDRLSIQRHQSPGAQT